MESDSPPPSPKASTLTHVGPHPHPHPSTPIMTDNTPIPLGDTTPTSSASTPLASSPTSGESLSDFDFSQTQDSRNETSDDSPQVLDSRNDDETSDESPDSNEIAFGSLEESYGNDGGHAASAYLLQESRVTRGFHAVVEAAHLELPVRDGLDDDTPDCGFPTQSPQPSVNEISNAVVLEFPSVGEVTSEMVEEMELELEEEVSPSVAAIVPPGPRHGVAAVPLELAAAATACHEMSGGRESLTHAQPTISLPSRVGRETTPEVSRPGNDFSAGAAAAAGSGGPSSSNFALESPVVRGGSRASLQWQKVTKEKVTILNLESEGSEAEFTDSPTSELTFREQGGPRSPLKRYKQIVDDDDYDYSEGILTSKQPPPPLLTVIPPSGVSPRQGHESKGEITANQGAVASVRSKRHRKRGIGLSLSLEDNDSDNIYQSQPRGHPQLRPQYSLNERQRQKPSFVVCTIDTGNEGVPQAVDSWDHSELEEDALEVMKIDRDKWRGRDISRGHKPRPTFRIESERHGRDAVSKLGEEKFARSKPSESDPSSYDGNLRKQVKIMLGQVKEEIHEVIEEEPYNGPSGKPSGKDCGHENPAYLHDEEDAVSQEENATDQSSQETPVEMSRRRSNPELTVPGQKSEEIMRSRSFGTELNKVMNNLNGGEQQEQEDVAMVAPTLRKRSTSRGRPENQDGKENAEESPPSTSKKENFVSFGPTFAYGAEESTTSSIFQKLVSTNPIMKLTRSESSKSHVGGKSGREEMFSRSISNIWEGGVRTKGHGGRPPQAPSSLPRDDHRHHKSALLQQHLYRNSRRNMQQRLLRQLSDVYHEDHRYNNGDPHHTGGGRHDYSHKKHDGHHQDYHHHHHHHHHHGRHNTTYHDAPAAGHGHHHRSQSQRHLHRPKHEPLRRINTYGHEDYQKYVQGHEHRYEQAQAQEHLQLQQQQHSHQGQGEGQGGGGKGGGGGGAGVLKIPEGEKAERRISHYRQEEKGKTDVERWVGVHGDQPAEGTPSQPLLPSSPGTPHIVVSPEDCSRDNNQPSQGDAEANLNTPGSNGPVFPNAQSTPAQAPTPAVNVGDEKRLSMTTLDLPGDGVFFKKTRRNSINEMHRRFGSQTNLQRSNSVNNIQRSNSRNSLTPSVLDWKQEGNDALIACLSALYGKLLVVMGMAFPTAEVISHDIPVTFYYGFYLYLYIGSIIFLVYAYLFLLHSINIPTETLKSKFHSIRNLMTIPDISSVLPNRNSSKQEGKGNLSGKDSRSNGGNDTDKEDDRASVNTGSYKTPKYTLTESNNHGSMYLKMGAVLFGIGSMIYSGLEVGQYFELKSDENCADILLAISPAARMLFTFIQMYFIFLNSRVAISRHRVIARFGLMHMIGTNLCIWLNVLVQETKHEIINLTLGTDGHHGGEYAASHHGSSGTGHHSDPAAILGHHVNEVNHTIADNVTHHELINDTSLEHNTQSHHDIHQILKERHHIVKRGASQPALSIYECRRSDLMGELVDEASPFLFPCTIEYSLLCAGVLYVIWKNINKPEVAYDGDSDISTYIARKARHHYSVDCAHANRGLFMGILVLVLTIISLILFFVLINNEAYKEVAILEANIIELSVYGVASVTVIIGMIQMRELEFIPEGDIELDNILLLIAQSGVYIYTSFTVIGGHFTMTDNLILPLLSAIITLLQTTLQTIFILDASRRCCYNHDQLQRKPGREMVTFLLVCNLAMWAINTFETSRADAHPTQLNFYGIWAWTIISHISMPLAIFYRFHVTVCLCEIWKRSYKLRHDY